MQGEYGITKIIYDLNISAFVEDNNRQIVMNFPREPFNTKLKALKNYGHIFTFRTAILDELLQNNESPKLYQESQT